MRRSSLKRIGNLSNSQHAHLLGMGPRHNVTNCTEGVDRLVGCFVIVCFVDSRPMYQLELLFSHLTTEPTLDSHWTRFSDGLENIIVDHRISDESFWLISPELGSDMGAAEGNRTGTTDTKAPKSGKSSLFTSSSAHRKDTNLHQPPSLPTPLPYP